MRTYTPSLFGSSNLTFLHGSIQYFFIEKEIEKFYQKIYEDAKAQIDKGRSVLIFFKDEMEVDKFKSSNFKFNENRLQDLNSITSNKEFVIKNASKKGFITICTKEFGR